MCITRTSYAESHIERPDVLPSVRNPRIMSRCSLSGRSKRDAKCNDAATKCSWADLRNQRDTSHDPPINLLGGELYIYIYMFFSPFVSFFKNNFVCVCVCKLQSFSW